MTSMVKNYCAGVFYAIVPIVVSVIAGISALHHRMFIVHNLIDGFS